MPDFLDENTLVCSIFGNSFYYGPFAFRGRLFRGFSVLPPASEVRTFEHLDPPDPYGRLWRRKSGGLYHPQSCLEPGQKPDPGFKWVSL
jgi:hypothetical protein